MPKKCNLNYSKYSFIFTCLMPSLVLGVYVQGEGLGQGKNTKTKKP
nr:MAG TPA: hypothetical protein [Caudoviricetes sp.]DAP89637.1 MAG TPA: hypothetical protein [Caudoviricetes sp.]